MYNSGKAFHVHWLSFFPSFNKMRMEKDPLIQNTFCQFFLFYPACINRFVSFPPQKCWLDFLVPSSSLSLLHFCITSFQKIFSIFFLNLDDPVVFISFRRPTSNTARTGFVLTCTSDANPPAFIFKWLCNGTQLPNETCNITFSETIIEGETLTTSEVVIRNPLTEDPCDFKCIAVSGNGSGSAVFNFTSVRK